MSQLTLKRFIILIAIVVTVLLLTWVFGTNDVSYRNKDYSLRVDEYGLMLFNNGGGDFQINKALKKDDIYLLRMYEYQGRKTMWVKMSGDKRLIDIDSNKIVYSNYVEINPLELGE